MKPWTIWIIVFIVVVAAGVGGFWLGHRGANAEKEVEATSQPSKVEEPPVASVGIAPLKRATISRQETVYGSVVAPANEVRVVSVPFECRVAKVRVMPGQTVAAGDPLIEIEASAATALMFQEAESTRSAAERDLQLIKQRYEQKLATNADLNTAENAFHTAQGRAQSLQQAGAGGPRQLAAEAPGIVSKVDVQVGQVVPIGSPLIEVAAQNKIEVKLSVEPLDAHFLKIGQLVGLSRVDGANLNPLEGHIRMIGAARRSRDTPC